MLKSDTNWIMFEYSLNIRKKTLSHAYASSLCYFSSDFKKHKGHILFLSILLLTLANTAKLYIKSSSIPF